MVLMRRLLTDAQGKFRQMMSDNKAMASRIDQDIQEAHVQVSALRAELADTNQRIRDIRLPAAMAGNVITTCMPPTSTTNTSAVVSNADGHWLKEVRSTYPGTDPLVKEPRVISASPTIADKGGTMSPTKGGERSGTKSPSEVMYSPHNRNAKLDVRKGGSVNGSSADQTGRRNDVNPVFSNEQNLSELTYGKILPHNGERPQVPLKQVGLASKGTRDMLVVKDSSDKPDSLTESSEASEEISVSKHKSNRRERRSLKGSDVQKSILNDLKSQQDKSKLDDSSKSDLHRSESDGNQNSAPECDLSISGSPFKEDSSKIIDGEDSILSSLTTSPRNKPFPENGSKEGDDFSVEFHRSSPPVKDDSNAQCFPLLKESSDIHFPHKEPTTNGHRCKAKTKSDPLDKRRDKDAQEFSVLSSPSSVMRHKPNVSKPKAGGQYNWDRFENKSSASGVGGWCDTRDNSPSTSGKSLMDESSSKDETSDSQDGIPSEFCDQRPIRNENQGGRFVVFDSKDKRRPHSDWRTSLSESYRDQMSDPWVVNKSSHREEVQHVKSGDEKRQAPEKEGQSNSDLVHESSYLQKPTSLDYPSNNTGVVHAAAVEGGDSLRIRNSALVRDLEEVMESRDEKAKENAALAARLEHAEKELKHAKEALSALKQDRKRLKAEKFDLLTQMKQLYSTLEDKEAELREFIRSYEQKSKESDESIKQMSKDREEMEAEKWSILKRARDESERAVLLCTQLGLKDAHIKELQDEIAALQEKRLSSHQDVRPSNGFGSPGSVSYRTANGGVDSRGTPTPTPGSDPTTSPSYAGTPTTQYADPMMSPRKAIQSHPGGGLSPTGSSHRPSLLSRSAEDIFNSEVMSAFGGGSTKKKSPKEKKGTWGSISRVFSRSKKRKPLDPDLFHGVGSRCSWSPRDLSEEGYAAKLRLVEESRGSPMLHWRAATVLAWLEITMDMPQYGDMCAENIKSGKLLLELNDNELEEGLGINNAMHRRRLRLAIEEHRQPSLCRYPKLCLLTHSWVLEEWLPSIALPCYAGVFSEHLVDGRVLDTLTRRDLEKHFGITRKFHQLSIMHGVQMLRMLNFDRQILHQRRMNSESMDIDPFVWSNQRLVKWAASIDLAEYADNLRGTGVHGAMAVLEPSFTADTVATALGIPASKNIIRRHLTTEWQNLIQPARLSLESESVVSKKCKSERRLASGSSSVSLVSAGRSGSSSLMQASASYARRTLDRYDRRRSSWRFSTWKSSQESLRSLTSRKTTPSVQTTPIPAERPHVLPLSPKLNRHRRTFSSHSDVETLTVTPV